jgi:hypothetical protein
VVGDLCFDACFSQLEPKPPSGGQTKRKEKKRKGKEKEKKRKEKEKQKKREEKQRKAKEKKTAAPPRVERLSRPFLSVLRWMAPWLAPWPALWALNCSFHSKA